MLLKTTHLNCPLPTILAPDAEVLFAAGAWAMTYSVDTSSYHTRLLTKRLEVTVTFAHRTFRAGMIGLLTVMSSPEVPKVKNPSREGL